MSRRIQLDPCDFTLWADAVSIAVQALAVARGWKIRRQYVAPTGTRYFKLRKYGEWYTVRLADHNGHFHDDGRTIRPENTRRSMEKIDHRLTKCRDLVCIPPDKQRAADPILYGSAISNAEPTAEWGQA